MKVSLFLFLFLLKDFTNGTVYDLLTICCDEGLSWSAGDNRCNSHPGYMANVSRDDTVTCRSIIELCCIKDVLVKQCANGKQNALDGQICAIRDSEQGVERFKECCICCELGMIANSQGLSCEPPNYGTPCDNMYYECCTGETYNNVTDTDYVNYNCEDNNPCEQRCYAIDGDVQCSCYEGFELNSDGRTCQDIDECADGTFQCDPSQQCINTPGRYTCHSTKCQPGYVYNRINRRCEENTDCDLGFGYNSVSRSCEDLNECGLGIDTCTVGERCDNTVGSYSCRRYRHCGTGYTLDENLKRCVDDNECALGTDKCDRGYDCINLQGSFRCEAPRCKDGTKFNSITGSCDRVVCNRGLRPNRVGTCTDINECSSYTGICNQYQQCINTIGSYQCRSLVNCPNGFETNTDGRCVDIDECAQRIHRCEGDQQCVNRQGSYFCQCPRGYRFMNDACEDVDECAYSAAICPFQSQCQNTPGSYVCTCKQGLTSDDRGGCVDVDECASRNMCHHKCINNFGSYFCTCNRGYQISQDKRTCEDIDECNQLTGRGRVCGGRCVNTPGSFSCDCPDGWRRSGDSRSCEDIDECGDGTAVCPSVDSICVNTRGGYKCPHVQCPNGFAKTVASGQQNAVRCKQIGAFNPNVNGLISLSYNFLTFPTNIIIPTPLFSMTGAKDSQRRYSWELKILSTRPLLAGVPRATSENFDLTQTNNQAVVTLRNRIQGPQDVVLQLLMKINSESFNGIAESKIYLYVTDGPGTFK